METHSAFPVEPFAIFRAEPAGVAEEVIAHRKKLLSPALLEIAGKQLLIYGGLHASPRGGMTANAMWEEKGISAEWQNALSSIYTDLPAVFEDSLYTAAKSNELTDDDLGPGLPRLIDQVQQIPDYDFSAPNTSVSVRGANEFIRFNNAYRSIILPDGTTIQYIGNTQSKSMPIPKMSFIGSRPIEKKAYLPQILKRFGSMLNESRLIYDFPLTFPDAPSTSIQNLDTRYSSPYYIPDRHIRRFDVDTKSNGPRLLIRHELDLPSLSNDTFVPENMRSDLAGNFHDVARLIGIMVGHGYTYEHTPADLNLDSMKKVISDSGISGRVNDLIVHPDAAKIVDHMVTRLSTPLFIDPRGTLSLIKAAGLLPLFPFLSMLDRYKHTESLFDSFLSEFQTIDKRVLDIHGRVKRGFTDLCERSNKALSHLRLTISTQGNSNNDMMEISKLTKVDPKVAPLVIPNLILRSIFN